MFITRIWFRGVICDLRHVRARSDLVEEIDSLTHSIGWMVIDLKPDQKWEVAHDRVMAQDLLSRSERKAGNLKKALTQNNLKFKWPKSTLGKFFLISLKIIELYDLLFWGPTKSESKLV